MLIGHLWPSPFHEFILLYHDFNFFLMQTINSWVFNKNKFSMQVFFSRLCQCYGKCYGIPKAFLNSDYKLLAVVVKEIYFDTLLQRILNVNLVEKLSPSSNIYLHLSYQAFLTVLTRCRLTWLLKILLYHNYSRNF